MSGPAGGTAGGAAGGSAGGAAALVAVGVAQTGGGGRVALHGWDGGSTLSGSVADVAVDAPTWLSWSAYGDLLVVASEVDRGRLVTLELVAAPKGRELLGSLQQLLEEPESDAEDDEQETDGDYDDQPEAESDEDFNDDDEYEQRAVWRKPIAPRQTGAGRECRKVFARVEGEHESDRCRAGVGDHERHLHGRHDPARRARRHPHNTGIDYRSLSLFRSHLITQILVLQLPQ